MIKYNEISDAVPEREKIKQLLIQEGASGSSFQEITLVLSDESLLGIQKLLVKAYDAGYNSGFDEGETVMQNTTAYKLEQEYRKGWDDGYDYAKDKYW